MKCTFFDMFIHPRATTRKLLEGSRNKWFWLFSLLYGFAINSQLAQWNSMSYEYSFWGVLVGSLVLAIPVGAIFIYIISFFLWLTGKLLRGSSSYSDMTVAVSWAHAPYLISTISWLVLLFSFGSIAYRASFPRMEFDNIGFWIVMLTSIGATIGGLWTLILLCFAIGEAQGLSSWMGLLNFLLGLVATWVVFSVIQQVIIYAQSTA